MTIKPEFVLRYTGAKLAFGVPLEDVFPENDIHPYLNYLFTQTYENISSSDCTIEQVLNFLQGTVSYRLELKERMEHCFLLGVHCPPGALLWIIRHFLGLLPLPILPRYANGQVFKWDKLSEYCKKYLLRSKSKERALAINKLIIEDLLRLPVANALLVRAFLTLLRRLVVRPFGEPRVSKYSALALVQYFCNSIFLRPYCPAYRKNRDKRYLPLLLYFILKWPKLHDFKKLANASSSTASFNIYRPLRDLKEQSTQTLGTIAEVVVDEDSFASSQKYQSCQTDGQDDVEIDEVTSKVESWLENVAKSRESCCSYSGQLETSVNSDFISNLYRIEVENKPKACCCTYGSHHEKSTNSDFPKSKVEVNSSESTPNDTNSEFKVKGANNPFLLNTNSDSVQYGWVNPRMTSSSVEESKLETNVTEEDASLYYGWICPDLNSKASLYKEVSSPLFEPVSFTDSGEYIYDEYNQTVYEDALSNTLPLETDEKQVQSSNNINSINPNECIKTFTEAAKSNIQLADGNEEVQSIGVIKDLENVKFNQEVVEVVSRSKLASQSSKSIEEITSNSMVEDKENSSNHVSNENNVFDRVSKMGWTYNSPATSKQSINVPKTAESKTFADKTNVGWTIPKENYKLCYGVQESESTNVSLKNSVLQSDSLIERAESTAAGAKNRKSFNKFRKVASKMDFLRVFSKKRSLKNAASAEEVTSKIKYQKMNSAKSNLF